MILGIRFTRTHATVAAPNMERETRPFVLDSDFGCIQFHLNIVIVWMISDFRSDKFHAASIDSAWGLATWLNCHYIRGFDASLEFQLSSYSTCFFSGLVHWNELDGILKTIAKSTGLHVTACVQPVIISGSEPTLSVCRSIVPPNGNEMECDWIGGHGDTGTWIFCTCFCCC